MLVLLHQLMCVSIQSTQLEATTGNCIAVAVCCSAMGQAKMTRVFKIMGPRGGFISLREISALAQDSMNELWRWGRSRRYARS